MLEGVAEPELGAEMPQPALPVRDHSQRIAGRLQDRQNSGSVGKDGEAGRPEYLPQVLRVVGRRPLGRLDVQTLKQAAGEPFEVVAFFVRGPFRRVLDRVGLEDVVQHLVLPGVGFPALTPEILHQLSAATAAPAVIDNGVVEVECDSLDFGQARVHRLSMFQLVRPVRAVFGRSRSPLPR